MEGFLKKALILFIAVLSVSGCTTFGSKKHKYDILTIGVSDVAKRYIDNYSSFDTDVIYVGEKAKTLSDIVTTYPPNNTRRTYKTSLSYTDALGELSNLQLPRELLDASTDGIAAYYYLTGNNLFWTICIEDITNNSIYLYLRGSGSIISSPNAIGY